MVRKIISVLLSCRVQMFTLRCTHEFMRQFFFIYIYNRVKRNINSSQWCSHEIYWEYTNHRILVTVIFNYYLFTWEPIECGRSKGREHNKIFKNNTWVFLILTIEADSCLFYYLYRRLLTIVFIVLTLNIVFFCFVVGVIVLISMSSCIRWN